MALDRDTVRRIAVLARIRVPDEHLDPLAGELSHILGWVEQLGEVDTTDVVSGESVAGDDGALSVETVAVLRADA